MCAVDPRFIAEGGWAQGEMGRETFKLGQTYGSLNKVIYESSNTILLERPIDKENNNNILKAILTGEPVNKLKG